MRINPKLYQVANEKTPVDKQCFDGRTVEVFLMDDFEDVKQEYVISKGQFAVWTSEDGTNYRLFIENGYYAEVSELYGQPVNQIWIEFWDVTDGISKKFSRYCIYPMMAIAITLCILSFALSSVLGEIGSYVIIGVLIALFIVMMVANSMTRKKITQENVKSKDKIIQLFGEEGFNGLIDRQKAYMDKFFDELYPEDAAEEETASEENTLAVEENTAAEDEKAEEAVEETKEAAEEAPVAEVEEEASATKEEIIEEK